MQSTVGQLFSIPAHKCDATEQRPARRALPRLRGAHTPVWRTTADARTGLQTPGLQLTSLTNAQRNSRTARKPSHVSQHVTSDCRVRQHAASAGSGGTFCILHFPCARVINICQQLPCPRQAVAQQPLKGPPKADFFAVHCLILR